MLRHARRRRLFVAGGANAALDNNAAEARIAKYGCSASHAVDRKVVGPAYQDVAAKYKGDAIAAAKLVDKVRVVPAYGARSLCRRTRKLLTPT